MEPGGWSRRVRSMNARRLPQLRILIALLAICTLATACAGEVGIDTGSPTTVASPTKDVGEDDAADRLAEARQKWADNGLSTYVMTTRLQCFCPAIVWKNTVIDGQAAETLTVGDEQFIEPNSQTMETLFDEVEMTIAEGYAQLDLEFDDVTGALISYWVDVEEMMADEEHGVTINVSAMEA